VPQSFIVFLSSWGVLALIVLILAAYRSQLGRQEDDQIHMSSLDAGAVSHQAEVAHKIDSIEKWGKMLTVLLVLYGLVLGGWYLRFLWEATNKAMMQ
jgi:hypothetical protein